METYKTAVRRNFDFLKRTTQLHDLFAKSIPLADEQGVLVPVCELHVDDEGLIATLASWREENAFAYPTQFPVTRDGTRTWLRKRLLDTEDRLLFLILDRHGKPVGHLGYASAINDQGEMEIDNVVRGVKDGYRGIMGRAMQAVLEWAEQTIGPRQIFLRVFSDNQRAVEFYHRLGFRDGQLTPLRKHVDGETISYKPLEEGDTAPPDKQFLRMDYAPQHVVDGSQMILTAGPSISAREASYALDAARTGWNHQWSKYLTEFERQFAEYVGVKHALATSCGTGAMHLSLLALGIGPGDEVILPDITWVATGAAVCYAGATPVFADVAPDSWCLDPDSFSAKITDRTKAVMPVHLYGHPARMDRIAEIARQHKLRIVEDAAPAIGAEINGRRAGSFGDFGCFSFQGAKLLVTGEGGIILTDDDALFERVHKIWDQGRVPGTFWIDELGWKYKMANIQAAIGLGQLERIDELVELKRRVFSWYEQELHDVPHITLNREAAWARSIYWMTSILLDEEAPLTRDDLRKMLKERGVDTRPVFPAVSQYTFWPVKQEPQPVAKRIGERAMNLPSGVCLKRAHVQYVCKCIRDILAGGK
ncbi:MAG: GNAT family N-acetyltransferase [Planctomycetes bacterium]|nr:GNAT family N-acetyltransferase [Planctomycetota bacterium]